VASRTSAFRFKGSDLGVDQIAEALGVTHVLEGSVRKAGDQVRITAQLIQADDGFHLWSETYDRQLDNIFAIQDEIAGNIAGVLEVQLLGSGKAYTTVHDLSPADYEKFLKARFLLRQRNDAAMAEAIELTSEVLANNPDFPIGLTQLAEGLVQTDREDGVDQTPEIRTLTDRALALEPDLAPAHMLEGQLAMDDLRPLEALRHFERAIALDPNEPRPHHWLGILLANSGYLDRARSELETAVELEPDHANANGYLGFVLLLQGDYDGAQRQFERQDRLGNPFGAQRQVQVAALKGNRGLAEQLVRERDGFTAIEAERLQHFIAALQDPAAINAYVAFIDQYAMDDWHVALELSILGQYERALAFDFGGYPRWSWADRFVEARALPAFQQKIERANLPEVWDAIGPPPACRKTVNGYDCANGELP
jgi:Flp pilus assembly protein TadD